MPSGGRRKSTWTKNTRPKSPGRPKGAKNKAKPEGKKSYSQQLAERDEAEAAELKEQATAH